MGNGRELEIITTRRTHRHLIGWHAALARSLPSRRHCRSVANGATGSRLLLQLAGGRSRSANAAQPAAAVTPLRETSTDDRSRVVLVIFTGGAGLGLACLEMNLLAAPGRPPRFGPVLVHERDRIAVSRHHGLVHQQFRPVKDHAAVRPLRPQRRRAAARGRCRTLPSARGPARDQA